VSYGDEVAYHEHYDLASSIREVEQQSWSAEEALQGLRGEISRLNSKVDGLENEVSVLRSEVQELTGRVETLEVG
jgi:predicted nuclease with TOPRIM domain